MRASELIFVFAITTLLSTSPHANEEPAFDCGDPLSSAPVAVKHVLSDLYHGDGTEEQLNTATATVRDLVNAAMSCRVQVQSPDNPEGAGLTNEWRSLHDWLSRIADFLYLNSRGRTHVDWKIEYSDFAKLYEFEA